MLCQIPAATSPATPPPPPNSKALNPHAQPYTPSPSTLPETKEALTPSLHAIFRQQPPLGLGLRPDYFSYNPVYVYQPKAVWSPYPPKLEQYNAYSQPLLGNSRPYHVARVGKSKKVVMGQVDGGLKESGFSGGGDKKIVKGVERFISPRCSPHGKVDGDKKWALKTSPEKSEAGPAVDYGAMLKGKTSLMIKNIPNHFDRHDLLKILDKHCRAEKSKAKLRSDPCRSEYDFVYLPMDFGFRANLGYAFVNFTSGAAALRFCTAFDKYEWEVAATGLKKKICEITCAAIQGKDGLVKNFENSKFSCHTRRYLPVTLSPPRDGWNHTRPTLIGRCIGIGAAPPINLRKIRLLMRKKALVN
ncbi:hypothetical protein ACOSQ2_010270 [Xanthoceras sorbifolium]